MTRINRLCASVAALLFVATGIMITYEVIARYFFTNPTIWAAELSQLCLIWGVVLALAWALEERRHIAVDAIFNHLPLTARKVTEIIAVIVIATFSAVAVVKGWRIFYDSFERNRTTGSLLDLPAWIQELSIPVGFALLFIQCFYEAHKIIRGKIQTNTAPME
jgi:TRAP-type C4-dicarboxylate transport system permease small subunit